MMINSPFFPTRFSSQVPKATLFGLLNDLYQDWRSAYVQRGAPCPLSAEDFQTLVLCRITQAANKYFDRGWDNLQMFYDINRPAFLQLIQSERARTDKQRERASSPESDDETGARVAKPVWHPAVSQITSYDMLDEIITSHERVLVMFTADYCRYCHTLRPIINQVREIANDIGA